MTYKIEPWIEKIITAIVVKLPDGTHRHYLNGLAATADVFDKHYITEGISVMGKDIFLVENTTNN